MRRPLLLPTHAFVDSFAATGVPPPVHQPIAPLSFANAAFIRGQTCLRRQACGEKLIRLLKPGGGFRSSSKMDRQYTAAAPPHVLHKDTTTATQTLSTGQFTFRIFRLSNAQFYPLATLTCSRFYAAAEFAREGLVRLGQTIIRPARVTAGSMPRLPQRRDQARKRRSGSREMTLD